MVRLDPIHFPQSSEIVRLGRPPCWGSFSCARSIAFRRIPALRVRSPSIDWPTRSRQKGSAKLRHASTTCILRIRRCSSSSHRPTLDSLPSANSLHALYSGLQGEARECQRYVRTLRHGMPKRRYAEQEKSVQDIWKQHKSLSVPHSKASSIECGCLCV